jgi:CheY-like chemotaxis protein
MPGEDGHALLQRVRALPAERGGATPAIALTAYASPHDRLDALQTGFQVHLSKPVTPAELATVVAGLVAPARVGTTR